MPIDLRSIVKLRDRCLKRFDLSRQRPGGRAIAAVLHVEHVGRRAEPRDVCRRAPPQAQAHQDGQRERRQGSEEDRPGVHGKPPVHASLAIRDHNRVTAWGSAAA
jgi:hypothetical protein